MTLEVKLQIEQLKLDLADSRDLNTRLHKRLQKCEGADLRLEKIQNNLQNELKKCRDTAYRSVNLWACRATAAEHKLRNLPFYIKWIYKL